MKSVDFTSRLKLTRLESQELGSSDLAMFHNIWTDPSATQWSPRGVSKTLEDSQKWMTKLLPVTNGIGFIVHRRPTCNKDNDTNKEWEAIGIVTLLEEPPVLPLPPKLYASNELPEADPKVHTSVKILTLGYLFLPQSWGQGYATEAVNACLTNLRDSDSLNESSNSTFIQAVVNPENFGSLRVLQKLDFAQIGIKDWKDGGMFLAGSWRGSETFVLGKYNGD